MVNLVALTAKLVDEDRCKFLSRSYANVKNNKTSMNLRNAECLHATGKFLLASSEYILIIKINFNSGFMNNQSKKELHSL